jgi:hypothetical protein
MGRWGRRLVLLGVLAGAVAGVAALRRQRIAATRADFVERYGT